MVCCQNDPLNLVCLQWKQNSLNMRVFLTGGWEPTNWEQREKLLMKKESQTFSASTGTCNNKKWKINISLLQFCLKQNKYPVFYFEFYYKSLSQVFHSVCSIYLLRWSCIVQEELATCLAQFPVPLATPIKRTYPLVNSTPFADLPLWQHWQPAQSQAEWWQVQSSWLLLVEFLLILMVLKRNSFQKHSISKHCETLINCVHAVNTFSEIKGTQNIYNCSLKWSWHFCSFIAYSLKKIQRHYIYQHHSHHTSPYLSENQVIFSRQCSIYICCWPLA